MVYVQSVGGLRKSIDRIVSVGRPRERDAPPMRADEGARLLEELKRQIRSNRFSGSSVVSVPVCSSASLIALLTFFTLNELLRQSS